MNERERFPQPKYDENTQKLIERSLSGQITKLHELDNTIRKLCTVVDDTEEIAALVKALLRQSLEIHYNLDQSSDFEDRQYNPVTPEYEGDNILKHPDVYEALESFLIYIQSEILDELHDAGKLDSAERQKADEDLNNLIEKPDTESKLIDTLERKGGAAGDAERQWRLVIQSYMNTVPKRDYHTEYVAKARQRWMEGVITKKDLGLGFVDMVNFTADPAKIDFLTEQAVKMYTKGLLYDAVTSKESEAGVLNGMRVMLGDLNHDPDVKRKNLRAWFQAITQRMLNKGIRINEGRRDV